jgi:hypothetical protein
MSQVANALRREARERLARLTAHERVVEALALGQRTIASYASSHRLDLQEARIRLERAAQRGRRPSGVMLAVIG